MRQLFIAVAALSLSACAATIGGKIQTFQTTDSISLQTRPRDFVATVERVGAELGYDITGIDRAQNKVTLGADPSMFTSVLIGKYGTFTMEVQLAPDGRGVSILATGGGNYKQGDREKIEKRVADFKVALVNRFRS